MRLYILLTTTLLLFGVSSGEISPTTNNNPALRYSSYQTTPICQPASDFARPKNIFDLQVLLLEAKLKHSTLKAVGSRHSATDIICTDGTPVIMEAFNTTRMSPDGNSATLGAGLTLGEALEFLEQNGRTFPIVPQYQGISIGGALGTGAHGSSLKHPTSLSDDLIGIKVLDGNGIARTITGDELNTFRVHIGLLGFVLEATFRVVPSFKLTIESKNYPDTILDDDTIVRWARENDYFVAQWWPHTNQLTVTTGVQKPLSTPGNAFQNLYNPSPSRVTAFTKQLTDFVAEARNLPAALALEEYSEEVFYNFVVDRLPYFTEDNIHWLNPATGLGWQLTSDICDEVENGCSWRNGNNSLYFDEEEIAVPVAEFASAIRTFKGIFNAKLAPFTFTGLVMRFQKASDATLYMAQGRDSCAFEFIYPQRADVVNDPPLNVATYQALVQAMVLKHGGRPHWGKNGFALSTPSIIKSQYPRANRERFIAAMIKYDPWGVFRNKFAYRLLGLSDKTDVDPAEIHCALRQNCFCKTDSDCANNEKNSQVCGDILDVDGQIKYKVCQDVRTYANPPLLPYNRQNFTSVALSIYGSYSVAG